MEENMVMCSHLVLGTRLVHVSFIVLHIIILYDVFNIHICRTYISLAWHTVEQLYTTVVTSVCCLLVGSYTHDIEAMSCDELFIDCGDLLADTGATCLEFASLLRQDIFDRTGCTASVGIGIQSVCHFFIIFEAECCLVYLFY